MYKVATEPKLQMLGAVFFSCCLGAFALLLLKKKNRIEFVYSTISMLMCRHSINKFTLVRPNLRYGCTYSKSSNSADSNSAVPLQYDKLFGPKGARFYSVISAIPHYSAIFGSHTSIRFKQCGFEQRDVFFGQKCPLIEDLLYSIGMIVKCKK